MRGTPGRHAIHWRSVGIIPTYAGNTGELAKMLRQNGDHPRVCGEHHMDRCTRISCPGSSPRMRGTHFLVQFRTVRFGIIPAYAGNTIAVMFSRIDVRDHPRVCGEHLEPSPVQNSTAGSSPRMRGTPRRSGAVARRAGIIPAYAGNTRHRISASSRSRDHPRVCGEHL